MTTSSESSQSQNTYILGDSGAEMARLIEQDRHYTKAMGGLLPEQSDLSTIRRVLDVACGPDGWALELAQAYPYMQVFGFDISAGMIDYANAQARASGLDNATFRVASALCLAKYSFSPDGRTLSITPMLNRLLQNAGYVDIQRTPHVTNFSTGMEAHADMYQDFSDTYRLVQPFLIKMGVTTQEEVDQVYQQMLAEMRSESFCAAGFYLTVWGKKP